MFHASNAGVATPSLAFMNGERVKFANVARKRVKSARKWMQMAFQNTAGILDG